MDGGFKKILVFDTETTGLPPYQFNEENYHPQKIGNKWETFQEYSNRLNEFKQDSILEKDLLENEPELLKNYKEIWPYIVQLSYIFFDTENNETIVKDIYINLPEKFTTSEYLAQAHPITRMAIEAGLQKASVFKLWAVLNTPAFDLALGLKTFARCSRILARIQKFIRKERSFSPTDSSVR
jgi:hypothetical protein